MILEVRDRILRECGRIAIFDDLYDLDGYTSEVRTGLTRWARDHRSQITSFHILTRSRLVAMGVTVANLAIAGLIRPHLHRSRFETALQEEIARKLPTARQCGAVD